MKWDSAAEKALRKVPVFVRPLVQRKVEEQVRSRGASTVRLADYQAAEARWKAVSAGKSEAELAAMLPKPNRPGEPLILVETCHGELAHCPHRIISPLEWKQAMEAMLAAKGFSERLRQKLTGDTILYHHKFRISISGCPNGCSRPQIADFGLMGQARLTVEAEQCTQCLACVEACPDQAVQVNGTGPVFDWEKCLKCKDCQTACGSGCLQIQRVGAKLMLAGKLGRHPRLAETVAEMVSLAETVSRLEETLEDFVAEGRLEERFADYWARIRAGVKEAGLPEPTRMAAER